MILYVIPMAVVLIVSGFIWAGAGWRAALLTVAGFAIAIVFNVWLAWGCELGAGAITWHGKECVWPSE